VRRNNCDPAHTPIEISPSTRTHHGLDWLSLVYGDNPRFLFLAALAAAAFGILYFFPPETRKRRFF
jgi:hypothetical protein